MQLSDNKDKDKESESPSMTLIVFGVSVLGYALAYVFQFGYLNYFDISYRFIEITVPVLVLSIGAVAFALLVIDILSGPYKMFLVALDANDPVGRFARACIRLAVVLAFPFVAAALVFGATLPVILLMLVGYVFLWLMMIAQTYYMVAYYWWKTKSFRQALRRIYTSRDQTDAFKDRTNTWTYGERYHGLFLFVILLLFLSVGAGRLFARNQDGMYVVHDKGATKTLLIQKTNDTLLVRDYNTKQHVFEPGFYVEPFDGSLHFQERISIKRAH